MKHLTQVDIRADTTDTTDTGTDGVHEIKLQPLG